LTSLTDVSLEVEVVTIAFISLPVDWFDSG